MIIITKHIRTNFDHSDLRGFFYKEVSPSCKCSNAKTYLFIYKKTYLQFILTDCEDCFNEKIKDGKFYDSYVETILFNEINLYDFQEILIYFQKKIKESKVFKITDITNYITKLHFSAFLKNTK